MQLTSTEKIEILSLDLRTNEAAIRKNMRKAGEAIFEIGKHLKHVKENVIESGKWTEWLQSMDID
ncbi:dimethyladenosine transferase, partial [Lysinibacillus sp. A4]